MARNPRSVETAPPRQGPASAAIRRHTSPTSNNKPSDSKLCRPSFFGEVGIDPLTEPSLLMAPFQTFADEDLADPAAAHGDAVVGQVGHQTIQGPAGKGQAQLGGPGQGRGDDGTALLGRIGRWSSGAHVLFQPVQTGQSLEQG